jgi:hypothetical protein
MQYGVFGKAFNLAGDIGSSHKKQSLDSGGLTLLFKTAAELANCFLISSRSRKMAIS